jgi:hypothetical protein
MCVLQWRIRKLVFNERIRDRTGVNKLIYNCVLKCAQKAAALAVKELYMCFVDLEVFD